jgi:hypothetical protein
VATARRARKVSKEGSMGGTALLALVSMISGRVSEKRGGGTQRQFWEYRGEKNSILDMRQC